MKHLLTLVLLVCLGTFASAQIPSYVPTNGLVGWWPFNGNANDESGNGNHGTVNGATLAADRFGNAGKAYSFDGLNDNIYSVVRKLPTGNSERSIISWINYQTSIQPPIYNDWNAIMSFGNDNGTCNLNYLLLNNNQTVLFNGCSSSLLSPSSNLLSNWHQIIITYRSDSAKLYIDGSLFYAIGGIQLNTDSSRVFFGSTVNQRYFINGLLDDIAIYNRALSAAEVQQLYLANCTQPTFTAQPQNKSVGQGQTTTFAVQVDTTSTFQWQMDNGFGFVNLVNSSLFSGVTTNNLTVKGSNSIDGYSFRCIATACQSDTSNAATLTVTSNSSTLGSVAGVPGKINYQGAAVDSLGKPMKNQSIALQLSVLDSSSSGAAAYVETHSTPTNSSGLFSLQIGGGTAVTGTFDSIPWANGRNKYLKTEVQQNGTWVNLGTSQLVSVPYALHAGSATYASQAATLRDSSGNAYQIKTVNGQPTLVSAPGNVSSPAPFACGQSVTYAGESYPTVQIGTQCWFAKNLNVGTVILGVDEQAHNGIIEKYCFNDDTAQCSVYGGLYQWAEAMQFQFGRSNFTSPTPAYFGKIQGICPTGWSIPSEIDFCFLATFIDTTVNCSANRRGTDAGGKLKSTSGLWTNPNNGATNAFGFSAIPSGLRIPAGSFNNLGIFTGFWSSTESSSTTSKSLFLNNVVMNNDIDHSVKTFGFSIRCLKD